MKYAKLLLVGILFLLGVWYYSIRVNATTTFNKGIYYDNIEYTDNVSFNSVDGVNIDYDAELDKPGDFYELYFDVINGTSYDVEITECLYNEDDEYIGYELTYDNGKKVSNGDVIKKGESVRLKYKVLYKEYVLDNDYTFDSSFSIFYEQVI